MVIGDVRELRKRVDYGPAANQRIHQMVTGKVRWLIVEPSGLASYVIAMVDYSQGFGLVGENTKSRALPAKVSLGTSPK